MVKLKTAFAIYVGFTLGILTAAGASGYLMYKKYVNRLKDMSKSAVIMPEVEKGIREITLEGSMWNELKDRKQYFEALDYKFDLENAEILKYHQGDKRLIVYIRDIHKEQDIQENTYQTIDELRKENGIDLLVLENFPNEEITKENLDSIINQGVFNKALYKIMFGFWTPETKEEVSKILDAGFTYEYFNSSEMETYGAEDEDFHDTAAFVAYRYPKSEGTVWLYEKIILDKRSEIDVKNTVERMKETGKDKAIFICGAAHTKGILNTLEEEGVSYLVIQPKGLDEKLKPLIGIPDD